MITRKMEVLLYGVPLLMTLAMSLTGPITKTYFFSAVDPQVIAVADMVTVGLGIGINWTINSEKIMNKYREWFTLIAILDAACLAGINLASECNPELRFIGFAITDAILTSIYYLVFKSSMNRIWEGDILSKIQINIENAGFIGSFIGGGLLFCINIDVHTAIIAQCVAFCTGSLADVFCFKYMKKHERPELVKNNTNKLN